MPRNGGRFTPEWVAGIGPESWPDWTGKRILFAMIENPHLSVRLYPQLFPAVSKK
jgi:hypothetical protein